MNKIYIHSLFVFVVSFLWVLFPIPSVLSLSLSSSFVLLSSLISAHMCVDLQNIHSTKCRGLVVRLVNSYLAIGFDALKCAVQFHRNLVIAIGYAKKRGARLMGVVCCSYLYIYIWLLFPHSL